MDENWTFPIQHGDFYSEDEWVARFANCLIDEMAKREMQVSADTALLTAGQLYAAQKIARALEMCEVRLERLADAASSNSNSTYEGLIDLGKSIVDAARVIADH
jgi:hypothetical protein